MNKKTDEIALKEYIKCAYKKLKSNSYYDNKNIFLKNRIVEFENNGKKIKSSTRYVKDIENKFEKLEKTILNKEKINFKFKHSSKLTDNYLKRQGCFTIRSVPKSIADDEYGNNIIRNFEKKDSNAEVDKLMYYIDIDIMSQIIGTLWVMIIGKDLENLYKDYTAGNLLEEDIDNNNLKLFKPYYLSYERWRDDAINIVDDRINNGNRSTMLSLDIKEYYYSINLDIKNDKEKIIDIFKNSKNKKYISLEIFKYINDYVFKVIEEYSNIMNLKELSDNTSKKIRNILPIGFLPSSILSNWYLKEFDEAVNSKINALYYKRYVDDILIVLNTDYKKQEVFEEESLLNTKFYDTELFEIGVLIDTKNKKETDKLTEVIILDSIKNLIKFVKKIDRIDIKLKQNILFVIENSLNKEIFNEEDI
ncbi:reverse transcriptase domain-containing protein, partial [Clostridium perfringens]